MINFKGRWYTDIEKFDGRIIDLKVDYDNLSEEELNKHQYGCAEYFTLIPISPLDYRKENPTQAKVTVEPIPNPIENSFYTCFKIYDDWGGVELIYIETEEHKEDIEKTVKSLIQEELYDFQNSTYPLKDYL